MVYDYFVNQFQVFLMVLTRLIGLFVTAPFFNGTSFPWRMKMGFGFFVTLIAVPMVIGMGVEAPLDMADYGVKLLSNFITGAGIGFFIYMVVTSFQVSAQVFSIPMGLGMNEVVDPMSQVQVPAMGNILGIVILLLLIRVDGQFYMIQLIVESFEGIDLFDVLASETLAKGMISALSIMFDIAIKISLPIIGLTLLLDFAMGLISRVAPQFNVMIMGFNIKLIAGFVVLWLIMPSIINLGGEIIDRVMDTTEEFLKLLAT